MSFSSPLICFPSGGSDGSGGILGTRRFGEICFGPTTNRKVPTPRGPSYHISILFFKSFSGLLFFSNSAFRLFQPMMDRNCSEQRPKMQCGFIDFVC